MIRASTPAWLRAAGRRVLAPLPAMLPGAAAAAEHAADAPLPLIPLPAHAVHGGGRPLVPADTPPRCGGEGAVQAPLHAPAAATGDLSCLRFSGDTRPRMRVPDRIDLLPTDD